MVYVKIWEPHKSVCDYNMLALRSLSLMASNSLSLSLSLNMQNGDTALHDACREGQLSLFYTLYGAKCNLDLPNKVDVPLPPSLSFPLEKKL